jgi:hypothetical protein
VYRPTVRAVEYDPLISPGMTCAHVPPNREQSAEVDEAGAGVAARAAGGGALILYRRIRRLETPTNRLQGGPSF